MIDLLLFRSTSLGESLELAEVSQINFPFYPLFPGLVVFFFFVQ